MLYKAMQVKEIPIIFRGNIDGGTSPDPSLNRDLASGYNKPYYECDFYQEQEAININILDNVEEAYFECDGVYYGKITKQETGPTGYGHYGVFGFTVGNNYKGDFSKYPFAFIKQSANTHYILFHKDKGLTANYKIWLTDPQILNPQKKVFSAELTGNGQIKRFHARFACGENGTLHINPYVILNGNITVNLCDFAKEGENYISGDNEDFTFECYVPIETHAMLYVEAENVGEYPSMLDVAIVVQYEDFIEEESIVGYEGINLRRNHR